MTKRFNLLTLVGLSLIIGLLPSCGGKPNPKYEEAAKLFYADESLQPIMEEQNGLFYNKTRKKLTPLFMSEQEAIDSLLEGNVYLIITTRRLTPTEVNVLKKKKLNARQQPLAYDGLALIVNGDNKDTIITVNEFKKILTGEITTWKQINPDSPLDTIRVAFDNPASSTVRFCADSLLGGKPMKTDGNIRAVHSSCDVIDFVETHKDGMGIVGSIWLDNQRDTTNLTYKRNITVMEVGNTPMVAVKPHQYFYATKEYPLRRTIWGICTDPRRYGNPRRFFNFLSNPGEQGQLIFGHAGLYPAQGPYTIRDAVIE